MAYIEYLLKDIEESISGKKDIYKFIHNDLTQEQLIKVKDNLKKIKSLLKQAKEEFNLDHNKFALSHVINVDCNFIWETIEDLWSDKLEKSSGKISSKEKKEKLDAILKQLFEYNNQVKNLIRK